MKSWEPRRPKGRGWSGQASTCISRPAESPPRELREMTMEPKKDKEIWEDINGLYPRLAKLDTTTEEIIYGFILRWLWKRNGEIR